MNYPTDNPELYSTAKYHTECMVIELAGIQTVLTLLGQAEKLPDPASMLALTTLINGRLAAVEEFLREGGHED